MYLFYILLVFSTAAMTGTLFISAYFARFFQLCQESLKELPPDPDESSGPGRGALPGPCEALEQQNNAAHIFMTPFELACQSKSPR